MVDEMDTPYVDVKTNFLLFHCRLRVSFPGEPSPGSPCSSKLVFFSIAIPGGDGRSIEGNVLILSKLDAFEVRAVYILGNVGIGGLDTQEPAFGNGCVKVTQRYKFTRIINLATERKEACEPLFKVPCARIIPVVEYKEQHPQGLIVPATVTVGQRIAVAVDGKAGNTVGVFQDKTLQTLLSVNLAGLDNVCEGPLFGFKFGLPCTNFTKAVLFNNTKIPLLFEESFLTIKHDQPGSFDNIHFNSTSLIDAPGCLSCFHMHWNWGDGLLTLAQVSSDAFTFFENHGRGLPDIRHPSQQIVFIHVARKKPGEEISRNATSLVNPPERFEPFDFPVLWLEGISTATTDSFFTFGAFVGPH